MPKTAPSAVAFDAMLLGACDFVVNGVADVVKAHQAEMRASDQQTYSTNPANRGSHKLMLGK